MKNEHIEVVKKWLADKDSVSQQELKANAKAAAAAVNAAANAAYAYERADAPVVAARWVKKYEELTNE